MSPKFAVNSLALDRRLRSRLLLVPGNKVDALGADEIVRAPLFVKPDKTEKARQSAARDAPPSRLVDAATEKGGDSHCLDAGDDVQVAVAARRKTQDRLRQVRTGNEPDNEPGVAPAASGKAHAAEAAAVHAHTDASAAGQGAAPHPVMLAPQLPALGRSKSGAQAQPSDTALAFMSWLQQVLASGQIKYNASRAPVHFTAEGHGAGVAADFSQLRKCGRARARR